MAISSLSASTREFGPDSGQSDTAFSKVIVRLSNRDDIDM